MDNNLNTNYFRAGADLVRALKELDLYTCRILAVILRYSLKDYKQNIIIRSREISEELNLEFQKNKGNISRSIKSLIHFGAIIVTSGKAQKKNILINPYFVDRGYNHGTKFRERLSKYLHAALSLGLITETQMTRELGEAYKEYRSTGTAAEQIDDLKKQLTEFEEKVMSLKNRNQELTLSEKLMRELLAEKDAVLAEKDARISDLKHVVDVLSAKLPDGMAAEIIEEYIKSKGPKLKIVKSFV